MASGWDNPYGDIPGLFVKSFMDAEHKRREDEANLAGLKQFTASFPQAFPSMGTPTPELARGVAPFLKEGYHQMARVAGEKELVPVRGAESRITNAARVDEELRKERELVPMRAAEARQTAASAAAAKAEEQRTTMRQEAESLGPMIEGLIGSPDVPDQQKVFLRGIHGAVTSGKPVDPGLIRTIMGEYSKRFGNQPIGPVAPGFQRTTHTDKYGGQTFTDAPEQIGPQAMAAQSRINAALKTGQQPDPGDMRIVDLARGLMALPQGGELYRPSELINQPVQPPAQQQPPGAPGAPQGAAPPTGPRPVVSRPPAVPQADIDAAASGQQATELARSIVNSLKTIAPNDKARAGIAWRQFLQDIPGVRTHNWISPEVQQMRTDLGMLIQMWEKSQGGVREAASPQMMTKIKEILASGDISNAALPVAMETLAANLERGMKIREGVQEKAGHRPLTTKTPPTPSAPSSPQRLPPPGLTDEQFRAWFRGR